MTKGMIHTLVMSTFLALGFIWPFSVSAQISTLLLNPSDIDVLVNKPQKVYGGSYSVNRLKGSSRKKFLPRNTSQVRLVSKVPRKMGISNYDISWNVRSAKGRNVKKARGKVASLNLAPGKYYVTLRVGKFSQKKTIRIRKNRNNVQSFSLPVNAGMVKARPSSPNKAVKMYVKNTKGKIIATSPRGKSIKQILKPGKYIVEAVYNNKHRGRNIINVTSGSIKETTVKMPAVGNVKIQAYEQKDRPLMKRSSWVVYDSSGKVVKRTTRNNLRLKLFPGTYTAKVTSGGKQRSKTFRVASGKNPVIKVYL